MSREPYLLMKNEVNYAALKNGEKITLFLLWFLLNLSSNKLFQTLKDGRF